MPPTLRPPITKTPAELAAAESEAEAARAAAIDQNPDAPIKKPEPENLTVVETKLRPVEPYSHPLMYVERAQLEKMSPPEIASIGLDRGYFSAKEWSQLSKSALVEKFIVEQDKNDGPLHDAPVTPVVFVEPAQSGQAPVVSAIQAPPSEAPPKLPNSRPEPAVAPVSTDAQGVSTVDLTKVTPSPADAAKGT